MYLDIVLNEARKNEWDRILSFNYPGQVIGCSEEEIQEIEQGVTLTLPPSYKEFLRFAGKGLGMFGAGSDIFYDEVDLIELQQDARDILVENRFPQTLPDDAFVFWMHGGYMFCFFRTSEGGNPPVHFYRESFKENFAWNYHPSFTDFLILRMKADAGHLENARMTEERIARDWTRD